jgi:hypothetical protein
MQFDFPEAVVRTPLDSADPNRSFAARQLDVSHADKGGVPKSLPCGGTAAEFGIAGLIGRAIPSVSAT